MDVEKVLLAAAASAYHLTHTLPKSCSLADQLRRAASSAALNTTEGFGFSGAKEIQFFRIAYGSVQEAKAATQILAEGGLVDLEGGRALWVQLHRGGGMLYGLLRQG